MPYSPQTNACLIKEIKIKQELLPVYVYQRHFIPNFATSDTLQLKLYYNKSYCKYLKLQEDICQHLSANTRNFFIKTSLLPKIKIFTILRFIIPDAKQRTSARKQSNMLEPQEVEITKGTDASSETFKYTERFFKYTASKKFSSFQMSFSSGAVQKKDLFIRNNPRAQCHSG